MSADALDVGELADVATTIGPGDEVELENSTTAYKNPLTVLEADAVTFENPHAGDWTAVRVILKGSRGGRHDIHGVDDHQSLRDHNGMKIYHLAPIEDVAADGTGDTMTTDVDEEPEVDGSPPDGMLPGDIVSVAEYYDTLEEVAQDLEVDLERARAILDEHDVLEEVDSA